MSGTDLFSRAAIEYEQRIAQAKARRRAAEAEQLTAAQKRIEVTWRYLREGLERRAELFSLSLEGVWTPEQLAEHLGMSVERVEAIAGKRGGERS